MKLRDSMHATCTCEHEGTLSKATQSTHLKSLIPNTPHTHAVPIHTHSSSHDFELQMKSIASLTASAASAAGIQGFTTYEPHGGPAVSGYAPTVMRDGTLIKQKDPPQSPVRAVHI